MAIYLFLFVFCIIISRIGDRSFNHRTKVICITIIVFALSIIGGARDMGIGTDTEIYTEEFIKKSQRITSFSDLFSDGLDGDKGYLILTWLACLFDDKPQMTFFASQLFTIGFIFYAAYKINLEKEANALSYFVFIFTFVFYNMTYNYMRQFCALAILTLGLFFIVKQKWSHYMFTQIIAYFFHTSSLMFILVAAFYFVANLKEGKIKTLLICSFASIPLLFSILYYSLLTLFMNYGLITELYADRYGADSEFGSGGGLGIRKGILDFILLFIIIINTRKNERDLQFQVLLFVSYFAISLLSIYIGFLFRLSLYFYLPLCLYSSIYMYLSSKKFLPYVYFTLLVIEWYITYMLGNNCETYPYKSTLLGI